MKLSWIKLFLGLNVFFSMFCLYIYQQDNYGIRIFPSFNSSQIKSISTVNYSTKPIKLPESHYWMIEQSKRKNEIEKVCAKGNRKPRKGKLNLNNFLVDDVHKAIYCYVPKVACTQWKKIMMVLAGTSKNKSQLPETISSTAAHFNNGLKFLGNNNYSQKEFLKSRYQNYTKFLIVRHPLERLLSAYNNKFLANTSDSKNFRKYYGRHMIAFARNVSTKTIPSSGVGMLFKEFLFFLSKHAPSHMQEHWKPINEICYPCHIEFDFIGKFESIELDSNQILSHLGNIPENVKFPKFKSSKTGKELKNIVKNISSRVLQDLYLKYRLDYLLFNYEPNKVS